MNDAFLTFHAPAGHQTQARSQFSGDQGRFDFPHTGGSYANKKPPAPPSAVMGAEETASAPTPRTSSSVSGASGVVNHRRTAQEMETALRSHLEAPSAHPTLFSVLDKLDRLAQAKGSLPATAEIVGAQQKTDATTVARVEGILVTAWNHGLIRVYPNDAIELTAGGTWLIKEGRARRLALWSVNPRLDLAAICAIVHVEDGEGPIAEVPVGLLDAAPLRPTAQSEDATTGMGMGLSIVKERAKPAPEICPVWRGLLAAPRT